MAIRYSMKDLRQTYKSRTSWWGYFFLHPIALRLLWVVCNFTNIRPEAICLSSLVVGLAALPFFMDGRPDALFIGGLLALFSNLLDAMDGKLARLTGQVRPFGAYLDFLVDLIKHTLYIGALSIGQYARNGQDTTLFLGLAIMAFFAIAISNENLLGRVRAYLPTPEASPKDSTDAPKNASVLAGSNPFLSKVDAFFAKHQLTPAPCGVEFVTLMFIIGPLCNWVMPSLLIGGACFVGYSVLYTAMVLKQTRMLSRGMAKDRIQREKYAELCEKIMQNEPILEPHV